MSGYRSHPALAALEAFNDRLRKESGTDQPDADLSARMTWFRLLGQNQSEARSLIAGCREARVKSAFLDGMEQSLAIASDPNMRFPRERAA